LTIEPAKENCERPRVVTQSMTRTGDDAQFGRAVSLCENTGVGCGNAFVVVAVQHEQGPRREATRRVDRTKAAKFACPFVEVRRETRTTDRADLTRMFEESPRLFRPVVEVGSSAESRTTHDAWVIGGDAQRN